MKLENVVAGFITILVFISASSSLSAENLLENKSGYGETLRVWSNLLSLSGFQYSYKEQKGDIGLMGSKVKKIVKEVPEAMKEIRTFQNYRVTSFFMTLGSGGVLGFGITEIIDDNDQMGISLVAVGSAGLVGAIILDRIGYSYLKKGAMEFNNYLKAKSDTSEWEQEAVVYYPGSKSEKVATDMSVYGTFLPIAVGAAVWIVEEANSYSEPGDPYAGTDEEPSHVISTGLIAAGAILGPSLGYLYCREDLRGFLGVGIRAGLAGLTVYLSEKNDKTQPWKRFDVQNGYVLAGSAAILVSITYDIFKVDDAVRKYNRKRSGESFLIAPKYFAKSQAWGLGIEVKF